MVRRISAWFVSLSILLGMVVATSRAGASGLAHSLIKIQPTAAFSGASSLHLHAARNEYESFQVVLDGPRSNVTVQVANLSGTGGTIPATSMLLYRVAYLDIVSPSNDEGLSGRVPDALIPERDPFAEEQRNAFPIDVPAGENRLVWVDLFVPPTTPAGEYSGSVTVSSSGGSEQLTLSLTVWDFTLPSTSSLPTAFGYEGWGVLFGHYDNPHSHYDDIVPLAQRYLDSGLMHRITLSSVLIEDWDLYAETINWPAFDARWGEWLSGTRDLPFGLQDAGVTSIQIPSDGDTAQERVAYWQGFAQHFRSNGWFHLLFDYTLDEPSDASDYQLIKDRAALVHQADSGLRVLVTTDIQEAEPYNVENVIDLWVPIINFMHGKPYVVCWQEQYAGDQRSDYDGLVAAGKELWWYQSCMSHGCGDPPDSECYRAWPSYMVDHTAVRNRIMGWMSYRYDIRGELYFDVNYCYDVGGDPWQSQFYFDGNGDGTLYYPGRPDIIGGTTHIPIESIRLKQIRDGLEDYEYLLQLEQQQGRAAVLALVAQAVTNAYTYTGDPAVLLSVREQLGDALSGGLFSDGFESGNTAAWSVTLSEVSAVSRKVWRAE